MRIAQVAPVYESVPPLRYGGTERIVDWLTRELVARGHEVVVFGAGDSTVPAPLFPVWPESLRLSRASVDANALHVAGLQAAIQADPPFDVIHSHVDWVGLAMSSRSPVPIVSTLHGRLDLPEFLAVARSCPAAPLVSISESQRAPYREGNWLAKIHHGLPLDRTPFVRRHDGYLAFVGRISRDKRPDLAIRAARAAGMPLKIAAKLNGCEADRLYWREVIEPLVDSGGGVELVGEIGDAEKADFMGRAAALLFPVDWPEPFGLVAIEAMSFGTPVIARPFGALPEIVEEGRTGFLPTTLDEIVAAIRAVDSLDRSRCRDSVRRRFSVARMADDYEEVYRRIAIGTGRATSSSFDLQPPRVM